MRVKYDGLVLLSANRWIVVVVVVVVCFLRFVYESLNWQPNRAFIIFNYARRDAASIPIPILIPIPTRP